MTTINLGNIRFNWKGEYVNSTRYNKDDVVGFKGNSFIAKKETTGVIPAVGKNWDLMAAGSNELENKGDLVTHNGNNPINLTIGSEKQTLQVVNGMPEWRNQAISPSQSVLKLQKVNGTGGANTRVYLMADGTIKACGTGSYYSNGDPAAYHKHIPSRVSAEENVRFVEVFSGSLDHYGLTEDGEVWSWGNNSNGQLGHGNKNSIAIAKRIDFFVKNNIKIRKIFTSRPNQRLESCTYFLTTNGTLYGAGANPDGNLGNGTSIDQAEPVRCGSLSDIVDFSVSGRPFTCHAIQENGDLWVWGWNGCGQLGLGDKINRATPILHPSMKQVTMAYCSCGYQGDGTAPTGHSLILRKDGTIWATGCNNAGQLGLNDKVERNSFTQININHCFTTIFGGDGRYATSGAITDKGVLYMWGFNGTGLLGLDNTIDQLTPQAPIGDFQGNVVLAKIGGGIGTEGCIVQSGNQLWASGYSRKFNLGTGSNSNENPTFKKVIGISGTITEWGVFGNGHIDWGLGVLYDDGRVDACGANTTFGETGTQSATLHDVAVLTNVIF